MKKMQDMGGFFVAAVTPYDEQGRFSAPALHKLMDKTIAEGAKGFLIGGSSAECPLLTHEERVEGLQAAAQYENREKTKLMASVAAISTDEAIEYAKAAKALGYDAMISTVPYYYKFGMKAISAYYGALREAVDLPLFLYNFPGNTGVELDIADDHIRGMLTDGTIAGVQKMVHIAQAEQFYEQDYYTPSDDGFHVFDTEYGKIGIVVCFDRHYPESIRTESLMGAELILIPTVNTKTEPSEMFEWELRVQAFHNSTAVAMCNRVGKEGEMDFSGESMVVDANGDVIAKADDAEGILYAEVDLAKSSEIRSRRTYTGLRRTELYK